MRIAVPSLAAAITLAGIHAAGAEPVAKSFQQVLDAGYDIKAVTIVPKEAAEAVTDDTKTPQVLVTFQKGGSIAVCQMALSNWNTQPEKSMTNPKLCSVTLETPMVEESSKAK